MVFFQRLKDVFKTLGKKRRQKNTFKRRINDTSKIRLVPTGYNNCSLAEESGKNCSYNNV